MDKNDGFMKALKCRECGHHYGANGNYIHSRKCPKCQGGQPGPSL